MINGFDKVTTQKFESVKASPNGELNLAKSIS